MDETKNQREQLLSAETRQFVAAHANDDVRKLAFLAAKFPDVDVTCALDQIRGRQVAWQKLPLLAEKAAIVYPPHISMEQCSSQQTALYKAHVVKRLLGRGQRQSMADLTGGFGVDFMALSLCFDTSTYVEMNPTLCNITRANLETIRKPATVVCGDGVAHLARMEHANLIYIDPARRGKGGERTYAIADCTPDVLSLKDTLVAKADIVMIKLSPMLDWHEAVRALGNVMEVHIVAVANECKELLIVLSPEATNTPTIYCVNNDEIGIFSISDNGSAPILDRQPVSGDYLYEPNAAIMKSGCFSQLCRRYNVRMVAANSHLMVADSQHGDFPGRRFQVLAVSKMNKRELRQRLSGITKANIAARNFPIGVAELRRRLKLADGGDVYIFATTLTDGSHVLIICKKIA